MTALAIFLAVYIVFRSRLVMASVGLVIIGAIVQSSFELSEHGGPGSGSPRARQPGVNAGIRSLDGIQGIAASDR